MILAGGIGVPASSGSLTGGSGSPDSSSHVRVAADLVPPPTTHQVAHKAASAHRDRYVRILGPRDGRSYDGKAVGSLGERRALVYVRGTAEPRKRVFVSGNGDGTGSSRDDATVIVHPNGHWQATVNVYSCGPDGIYSVDITAGYDEPFADEDMVRVHVGCPSARQPVDSDAAPAPASSVPAGTTCAETPARNFPVPPGDPRDRDGDGIACET